MAKPQWQRARKIAGTGLFPLGVEFWVRIGPPETRAARTIGSHSRLPVAPRYTTHLKDESPQGVSIRADRVELLARGPDDFAVEVETECFWEWKKRIGTRGDC